MCECVFNKKGLQYISKKTSHLYAPGSVTVSHKFHCKIASNQSIPCTSRLELQSLSPSFTVDLQALENFFKRLFFDTVPEALSQLTLTEETRQIQTCGVVLRGFLEDTGTRVIWVADMSESMSQTSRAHLDNFCMNLATSLYSITKNLPHDMLDTKN